MCFYYSLNKKQPQKLINANIIDSPQLELFNDFFLTGAFDYPLMPVITEEKKIELMHWGLIPSWIDSTEAANDIRSKTINARSETVFEKKSFKYSVNHQRCLVPSSGYVEWKKMVRIKYLILFHSMMKACIVWLEYTVFGKTRKQVKTYSILTSNANDLIESIHDKKRMPVIVEPEVASFWLHLFSEKKLHNFSLHFHQTR